MDELPAKLSPENQADRDSSALAERERDAWARAKITAALKQAIDHPDQGMALDDVWKRFGLEH